jgi:DNA polymerase alpha subunit A
LYEEVDEDDYKQIVKGRLDKDDFIEDDDGGGYVDNGMDVFEEEVEQSDDEEDTAEKRKQRGKFVNTQCHPRP